MSKRAIIAVLLIAIAAVFLATLPSPSVALSLNEYETQILALVNEERAARDLPVLKANAKLTKAARHHSREMAEFGYFAHDSYSGETWRKRLVRYGYGPVGCKYWRVGENIFWGSGVFSSPVNVVDQWMASSSHKKTLLTKTFRAAGIGAVRCDEGYAGCEEDVWFFTLDLGRRVLR